ncbi:phosphatase PAP2 family protein [Chloroflexota bacterium]
MPPLAGWTLWVTGFVGKVPIIDNVMSLMVSDFFMPVTVSLIMLGLWIGLPDRARREHQQRAIMAASASIGIAIWGVQWLNHIHLWPRPFDLVANDAIRESARHAAEIVFYMPHDPSFPSNAATMVFAAATGVWFGNRKAGVVLYALAFIYAFARFYAGVHFFVDIVGGAVLGSLISYIMCKYIVPNVEPLPTLLLKLARFLYIA